MTGWAACVRESESEGLAALRLFPGIECLEIEGATWLRGAHCGEDLERALAKISGLERFEVLPSGQLKSPHSRIPGGVLPVGEWRPLRGVLTAVLPSCAFAGETSQKLAVTLGRSRAEQMAGALLTPAADWLEFAGRAPNVRLERLSFAAAEDRQMLVLGEPLPALRGRRLVNQSGILTPGGFEWTPPVDAAVLRELFALRAGDVVVLTEDNTHQVIRAEQFVRASRSAARATAEGFRNE